MGKYVNPRADYFIDMLNEDTFVGKSDFIPFCNKKINTAKKWMGV